MIKANLPYLKWLRIVIKETLVQMEDLVIIHRLKKMILL